MKRYKNPGEIKVGVVGYGGAFNMGKAHFAEMQRAGMTPVAVAEIDPARLEAASKDFPGIGTFKDLPTMLKKSDVDLVTLITPHNTHAKLALQALAAGKHVVCEKPLAITTAECDAMIAMAKKKSVVLSTYHNRHWDGWILGAVKHIGGGMIGDVVRVEARMCGYNKPGDWWRSSRTISGGVLYDWGVHLLEYGLQLIDSDIVEVSGFAKSGFWANQTAWGKDTNEDEGQAIVRFRNGAFMSLLVSNIDSNPRRGMLDVTGTKGSYIITWEGYNECIQKDKHGNVTSTKLVNPPGEGHKFYQNVADHLVKGEKLIITGEWSRRPIHILDLACRSYKKGAAIKAKYK
ncbi:MAG: Gfo/Idh/MocA family oxidoreductase [Phycisphaerae bacterium]|nr:Gfo/Idh/MocA family oxidoreductase [Phycisphaerae bacterium]